MEDVEGISGGWSLVIFFIFVSITLFITWWAARYSKDKKGFYTAGGGITPLQNGLAIAGDFMSAASFLGIVALVFSSGFDGLLYSVGFLVGWPIVLVLIAGKLRNLGRFSFADVTSYRLDQKRVRLLSAISGLCVVTFYLIAQMVGAGQLINLMFGLHYSVALVIVGVLMIIYVAFGGMTATTWVQIVKAVLLLFGATVMAFLVLFSFNFDIAKYYNAATSVHPKGEAILRPGGLVSDTVDSVSLGLALMFGTCGLPHILLRFFTVKDERAANNSVVYATGFIGYFYMLTFILGFGAIAFLYLDNTGAYLRDGMVIGGKNVVALHLAHYLGGDLMLGFISAVAFATILAVVAGLSISGANNIAHDIYNSVIKGGKADPATELKISKISTFSIGIFAILLGIAFEKQNVAYMVGLAFAIAASVNFPILLYSIYWRGLTTNGAFYGGWAGLLTVVLLMILSPSIWVETLGFDKAIFPYKNPALFSMSVSFVLIYLVSKFDKSARAEVDKSGFDEQYYRAVTGSGASKSLDH